MSCAATIASQLRKSNNRFERSREYRLRRAKEEVDDWDKAASFVLGALPRRSTSSLDNRDECANIFVEPCGRCKDAMAIFRVCLGLSLVPLRWRSGDVDARAGGICSRFNVVVSDRRVGVSHFRVGCDHTFKAPRSHYFASRDLASDSPSSYSGRAGAIALAVSASNGNVGVV
jgi:hypothetical protein